jgi:hypothetical protein
VQRDGGRGAQARDAAGVRRDLGLHEDDAHARGGLVAANRELPRRGAEDESAAGVRGDAVGELIIGGAQKARRLVAVLDAAVEDIAVADGEVCGSSASRLPSLRSIQAVPSASTAAPVT